MYGKKNSIFFTVHIKKIQILIRGKSCIASFFFHIASFLKKGKAQIKMLTRIYPCYNGLLRPLSVCVRTASNSPMSNSDDFSGDKDKKMSRAMRYYLQKRRNYEEFIGHHQAEFDLGKQHLANMMGVEAKTMTQKDIDEAIGKMKQKSQKFHDFRTLK